MSSRDEVQVRDVFAVYRAIDALVARDDSGASRDIAVRYIPEYEDDATVGWAARVAPLFRSADVLLSDDIVPRQDEEVAEALDALGPALERIANATPRGRTKSRLVIGLAVLGRLPTIGTTIGGDQLRRAFGSLRPSGLDPLDIEPEELVDLALDDTVFPNIDSFESFALRSASQNLMSADVAGQAPKCSDSVTMVDIRGELQPVTRLWTSVDTRLTADQITRFVDPMNWPACNAFYCDPGMIDGGPAADGVQHLYTEVLSTDCGHNPPIEVGLWFTIERDEHGFSLSYDLAPPPHSGNGFVEYDKGQIVGEHKGGGLWTVTSTKFLRFSGVLDGTPLALTACVLGYGNYALDFVAKLADEQLDSSDDEIADWDPNYDPDRTPDPPDPDPDPGWDQDPPDPT